MEQQSIAHFKRVNRVLSFCDTLQHQIGDYEAGFSTLKGFAFYSEVISPSTVAKIIPLLDCRLQGIPSAGYPSRRSLLRTTNAGLSPEAQSVVMDRTTDIQPLTNDGSLSLVNFELDTINLTVQPHASLSFPP